MKLIFALGNPGEEYTKTRHNVGFIILDMFLQDYLKSLNSLTENKNLCSTLTKYKNTLFAKNLLYMNESGISLSKVKNYYNIKNTDIIVIHDDIDQNIGSFKFVKNGGSAGHKGIENIYNQLAISNKELKRLKVGIAPNFYDPRLHKAKDFVLKKFSKEELIILQKLYNTDIKNILLEFIENK